MNDVSTRASAPLPLLILVPAAALAAIAAGLDYLHASGSPGIGGAQRAGLALSLAAVGTAGFAATPFGRARIARLGVTARTVAVESAAISFVAVQLALLVAAIRLFRIESPAFHDRLAPLILAGFVGHHLLPRRWRLTGFVALSLGGFFALFGREGGAWLVGVGLGIIAVARLRVRFGLRVAALALLGLGLAAVRGGAIDAPVPTAIWPILGSMFMFRLIVYVYDAHHSRTPVGWRETLAYFFLLPNPAFPLFPVVDFATFRRTYYDRDAIAIYQQGIAWIARGLTHLIAYRFVYQTLTISPAEVTDLASLTRYALANFGLYLRVSGQFHLIVGVLHLFGFRLPETHRFFYLASSIPDFWRRINIYWKDFMTKVVFNPVMFRLRRLGQIPALVMATLAVFAVTWATHAYQWFWILGSGGISSTDTAFWGLLAALMVFASVRELRRGRVRTLGSTAWSWRRELRVAAGTAVTFALLCALWTLWTSPSFAAFAALLAAARPDPAGTAAIAATLAVVFAATLVIRRSGADAVARPPGLATATRNTAMAAMPLALLCLAAAPPVANRLGPQAQAVARDVRVAELNRRDAAVLQRGYYEQLVGVNRFNGQLWEVYSRRGGKEWPTLDELGAARPTGDLRRRELEPFTGVMFRGQPFRTNRWGMRDREYEERPGAGTFRIGLLGASTTMGHGVGDGEPFESLVEDRLNREVPVPGIERYELLNFAVSAYTTFSHLALVEKGRVFRFGPQAVLLLAHDTDLAHHDIAAAVQGGRELQFPEIRRVVAEAGLERGMPREEMMRRLEPRSETLLLWAYRTIVERCRARGIDIWWAYLPLPRSITAPDVPGRLEALAREAGFSVIDLGDPWAGHDPGAVMLDDLDRHPTAEGHRLLADRLYHELVARIATAGDPALSTSNR